MIAHTYGFKLVDLKGNGFKRWFTDAETMIVDNPEGKLPMPVNSVYITQHNISFHSAYNYCQIAAKEHNLVFTILEEKDFNDKTPSKNLFRKLLKRKEK